MDFKWELAERTENIEKILKAFAPEERGFQKKNFSGDELQPDGWR